MDMTLTKKDSWKIIAKIRAAGYDKLIEVYECEINKSNKDFKTYMKTWDREIVGPLEPYDMLSLVVELM